MAGAIWIDPIDKQVARVEARLVEAYKIGGGVLASLKVGANFTIEQERVNQEIWLPTRAEINLGVRVLLVKGININHTITYGDYKRFSVESEKEKLKDHHNQTKHISHKSGDVPETIQAPVRAAAARDLARTLVKPIKGARSPYARNAVSIADAGGPLSRRLGGLVQRFKRSGPLAPPLHTASQWKCGCLDKPEEFTASRHAAEGRRRVTPQKGNRR